MQFDPQPQVPILMGKEEGRGAGRVQGQLEVRKPEGVEQALVVFGGWVIQGIVQGQADLDRPIQSDPRSRRADIQPGPMQGGTGGRGQVELQLHRFS